MPVILLEIEDKQRFQQVTGDYKNWDIVYLQKNQLEMLGPKYNQR